MTANNLRMKSPYCFAKDTVWKNKRTLQIHLHYKLAAKTRFVAEDGDIVNCFLSARGN